jgi:hypothetical protein
MDKTTLGFLADVLYIKGHICYAEFEDIQAVRNASDLEKIVEKMLMDGKEGGYSGYKKGESYIGYKQL